MLKRKWKLLISSLLIGIILISVATNYYVEISNHYHRYYWYFNGMLLDDGSSANLAKAIKQPASVFNKLDLDKLSPQVIGHAYGNPNNMPAESRSYYMSLIEQGYQFIEVDIVDALDGVGIAAHLSNSWNVYDAQGNNYVVNIKELSPL